MQENVHYDVLKTTENMYENEKNCINRRPRYHLSMLYKFCLGQRW